MLRFGPIQAWLSKLPCWLFGEPFETGLLAAKTAAAAAEAGTVGKGIDVDGIDLIRDSNCDGWTSYWAWLCTSLILFMFVNLFSYPTEPIKLNSNKFLTFLSKAFDIIELYLLIIKMFKM